MTFHGTIQNGVVILEAGTNIPDGTEVSVFVPALKPNETVSRDDQQRRKAALAELLAIPDENPGDSFRAADHDQVLYGDRR